MTTNIADKFVKQINKMPACPVRTILLANINPEAQDLKFIFHKGNKTKPEKLSPSLKLPPLILAFAYGSKDLQNSLIAELAQMPPVDAVELLTKPWDKKLKHASFLSRFKTQDVPKNFGGLVQLFASEMNDETTALQLLDLAGKLEDKQLASIFYGQLSGDDDDEEQDPEFLLNYLDKFSSKVTLKVLNILARLPDAEVERILLTGGLYPVAFDAAFVTKDSATEGSNVAIAFIKLLSRSEKLSRLLYISPGIAMDPYLHRLVKQQYHEAQAYYLEQKNLKTNHHNDAEQTAYMLATQLNHSESMSIFQAQTAFASIDDNSVDAGDKLQTELEKYPNLLNSGQNLVHRAIAKNNLPALKILLKNGAAINSKDKNGLSPLAYALKQGNIKNIRALIKHQNHILAKASIEGSYPSDAENLFAEGFQYLHLLKANTKSLDQILAQKQKLSHLELIDYCKNNKDSATLFLINAAHYCNNDPEKLAKPAALFVKNILNNPNEFLIKQLMFFLFNIKPGMLARVINSLELNPEQRRQLDFILCRGLVQPLVFTALNLEDLHELEWCFTQPEKALSSIAKVHCRQTDLSLLPIEVLVYYAARLSDKDLQQLALDRFKGPLLVLALNRIPSQEIADKLTKKLNLLKQNLSEENLKELKLLLNLATSEAVKKIIRPHTLHIREQILNSFKANQDLVKGSLFREILIDAGKNLSPQNAAVLTELIPCLNPDEVINMIGAQLKNRLDAEETPINNAIIKGILAHPDCASMLSQLFQWALSNKSFAGALITEMPSLLKLSCDWPAIDTLLTTALAQYQQIQLPLMDLEVLSAEPSDQTALAKVMESWTAEHFYLLIHLNKDKEAELNLCFQACLEAKNKNLPLLPILQAQIKKPLNLNKLLAGFKLEHSQILSMLALKEGLYLENTPIKQRLQKFSNLITKEAANLTSTAIELWINSYQQILANDDASSQDFINAMALVINDSPPNLQAKIIQNMSADTLKMLLRQSVSGLHSDDENRREASTTLLTCFAHTNSLESKANAEIIKEYLCAYDAKILKHPVLMQIAETILGAKKQSLMAATIDGIWITRLILNPVFLAACPIDVLRSLIERYRLISLTLKQAEYETLSKFPHLLAKQQRLLNFRADNAIRELLLQAEANIREASPEISARAMATLCGYYNEQLANQCTNFLFQKMSNLLQPQLGDLRKARNTLYNWITSYLPDLNFEQREFFQKTQGKIFNEAGKEIGFIHENNYAMTSKNDLLINMDGIKPGLELFDEHAQKIGVLKASGEVLRNNLFAKSFAAQIIINVPIEKLTDSRSTLNLLLHKVVMEEAVDLLYDSETLLADDDKLAFVENELNQFLVQSAEPIPCAVIQQMLTHHENNIVQTLETIKHPSNAQSLFNAILANDSKRHALFQIEAQEFANFFKRVDPVETLAAYIEKHHDKPWFNEGLSWFATNLDLTARQHVLLDAIKLLSLKYENNQITEADFNSIMQSFLKTEATAKIILRDFFLNKAGKISESISNTLRQFTYFFTKAHFMPCIEEACAYLAEEHKERRWWRSSRYRLLLTIFGAHQESVFDKEIHRYSQDVWEGAELSTLAKFLNSHFKNKNNPDKRLKIGGFLLGELAFFAADCGDPSLFYINKEEFNPQIAGFFLERSLIESLIAKIPNPVKNAVTSCKKAAARGIANVRSLFDSKYAEKVKLVQELKDEHAIVELDKRVAASWEHVDGRQLSLFCAFLCSYIGPASPLIKLLNDFITSDKLLRDKKYLYAVSKLLSQIPEQNVSKLIFVTLSQYPDLLDATILKDMAYFYQKNYLNSKNLNNPIQSSLDLIRYFGQQKNYELTAQCAAILKTEAPKDIQDKLQKIQTEAEVEGRLSKHSNKFYFWILCIVKRFLNYKGEASGFVCFCDKAIAFPKIKIPEEIGNKILGGKYHEQAKKSLPAIEKLEGYRQVLTRPEPQLPTAEQLAGLSVFKHRKGQKITEAYTPVSVSEPVPGF